MTQKVKRKLPLFPIILVSVLILLCAGIAFGLKLLWNVLEEYESTMPSHTVDEIGRLFTEKNYDEIITLAGIGEGKFDKDGDLAAYLEKLFSSGDIKWGKKAGSGNANCYVVAAGKTEVGQIYIREKAEKTKHGFTDYEFDRLTVPFAPSERVSVTVPEGFSVYINGVPADSGYIAEDYIAVSALKDIESEIRLPHYEKYEISGLIAPVQEVKVVSPDGKEIPVAMDGNAYFAEFSGDSALQEQIYPIIEDFAVKYSEYLTNDGSFRTVAQHIVSPSSLYTNLRGMETYFYTKHDSYKFENITPYGFVKYTDELCAASISFDHYLYRRGRTQEYHYPSDFTVYFVQTDDGWLVDSMRMNYTGKSQENME